MLWLGKRVSGKKDQKQRKATRRPDQPGHCLIRLGTYPWRLVGTVPVTCAIVQGRGCIRKEEEESIRELGRLFWDGINRQNIRLAPRHCHTSQTNQGGHGKVKATVWFNAANHTDQKPALPISGSQLGLTAGLQDHQSGTGVANEGEEAERSWSGALNSCLLRQEGRKSAEYSLMAKFQIAERKHNVILSSERG